MPQGTGTENSGGAAAAQASPAAKAAATAAAAADQPPGSKATSGAAPSPGLAAAASLSSETLRAYQALCAFASWALYADPDEQALRGLCEGRSMLLEKPFSQVAPEASAALAAELAAGAEGPEGLAALMEAVRRDRTYLFFMVGASKVSPYESVYRTEDATMFGPQTLEVRAAYRSRGLEFEHAANEPDDHVGLEFSFAARCLGQAADGDAGALDALRDFLSEHLLAFGPLYLERLGTRAQSAYYRSVAGIAAGTLAALADALGAEAAAS